MPKIHAEAQLTLKLTAQRSPPRSAGHASCAAKGSAYNYE